MSGLGAQIASDTTHLFYAGYKPQPDFASEVAVNGPMLENLLDELKTAGAPLERVVSYQGSKVYGIHLGPVVAPFYETDVRHVPPNFYYMQEDTLRRRSDAGRFGRSMLRPDVVIGDVAGNAMNMAMIVGVFAAICKTTGTPFRFPAPRRSATASSPSSPTHTCSAAQACGARRPRPHATTRSTTSMNQSVGSVSGVRSRRNWV